MGKLLTPKTLYVVVPVLSLGIVALLMYPRSIEKTDLETSSGQAVGVLGDPAVDPEGDMGLDGSATAEASVEEIATKAKADSESNTLETSISDPGGNALEALLEEVLQEKLQIDNLKALYLEGDHEIVELDPPTAPVTLRVKHSVDDIGKTSKHRSILMMGVPSGMKTGRLMISSEKIVDVNEADNSSRRVESCVTTASFVAESAGVNWDAGELSYEDSYTVGEDGARAKLKTAWKSANFEVLQITDDIDQAFIFPQEKMELNRTYTHTPTTTVSSVPPALLAQLPNSKIDVTLKRRVLFDGHEAYEIGVEQSGFFRFKAPRPTKPVTSILKGEGKYYVSAETGRVLWREMNYELSSSTLHVIDGGRLTIRKEAIPELAR